MRKVLFGLLGTALFACGSPRATPRDSGSILPPIEPADASVAVLEPNLPSGLGKVEVKSRWLWPEPRLRRSPGRNSCGVSRDAALTVELMGGLSNTAVYSDEGIPPASAGMAISQCRLHPRVVVIGPSEKLSIENLDERPHQIVVEELKRDGTIVKEVGRMPMRIAGQRYQVSPGNAELLRIYAAADPKDFAYVVISRGAAAVTDDAGIAQLEFPAGSQTIHLWHPPTLGAFDKTSATLNIEVTPQHRSKHVVDVAPNRE